MIRLDDGQVTMVRSAMALGGEPQATRVVVAMSGGVEFHRSSAALLKVAGYDVVGITLQLYDHGGALRPQGGLLRGAGYS